MRSTVVAAFAVLAAQSSFAEDRPPVACFGITPTAAGLFLVDQCTGETWKLDGKTEEALRWRAIPRDPVIQYDAQGNRVDPKDPLGLFKK